MLRRKRGGANDFSAPQSAVRRSVPAAALASAGRKRSRGSHMTSSLAAARARAPATKVGSWEGPDQGGKRKTARMACKPDSVRGCPLDDHSSGSALTRSLKPPTRTARGEAPLPGPVAGARGARSLFGVAPGGACRAGPVASPAVGSYPTVSPLPQRTAAVSSLWRFPWGCPRRALPGTVASWSPDFPRPPSCPRNGAMGRRGHPAIRARAA